MNETITLRCKSCGKELQIPAELEQFSCLYCGEKMSMAEMLAPAQTDPEDERLVREHLFDCVSAYPEYFKRFNRVDFQPAFDSYLEGITPIFSAMDRCVCAQPARRQELISGYVAQFLAEWESWHQKDRRWKLKTSRERMLFDDKLTLAWFTVPAIRELGLSVSEDFTELLQKEFVKKYPKNIFERTTLAEIKAGFRRRKLCFITTAVCEAEGKPDDCAELTAFRAFRDGWLANEPDGLALTEEYYRVAPLIVRAIDVCDDRERVYAALRRDWLAPCYADIRAGDFQACKRRYTAMVRRLQSRYRIS